MFRDPLECYEAIGTVVNEAIHEPWVTATIEARRMGESIRFSMYYTRKRDGSEGTIPYSAHFLTYFSELAQLTSTEGKGLYATCTYVLHSEGRYDVKFTYEQ